MNSRFAQKVWIALAIALLSFGCNQAPTPPGSPTASDITTDAPKIEPTGTENTIVAIEENPADSSPVPASDDIATRLEIAGITDPQAARDFLSAMRVAAAAGDRDAIANLVRYPFTTYDAGSVQKEYVSSKEFISDFDNIVTASVISAMKDASYDELFVNYQGAMIGDGEVWFMGYDEGIRIKAINGF